jgi:hypothetical protein
MATVQNIYIDQGSTFTLSLNVTDQFGDIKDLSDYTVTGQIRKSYYSSTAVNFDAEASLPLEGEITISLTSTQTNNLKAGRYVYDVEIASELETIRVIEGIVVVNPGVTR